MAWIILSNALLRFAKYVNIIFIELHINSDEAELFCMHHVDIW